MHAMIRTRRRPSAPTAVSWQSFHDRYFSEAVIFMADNTQLKVKGVFASVERLVKPKTLDALNAQLISSWSALRKREGAADTTIRSNLATIRAALAWAVDQELLEAVPKINLPKRAKSQKMMKGRAVTPAEFDQMLDACPDPDWRRFLNGLWWSGLRLSEAINLSWDDINECISVDFSGEFPMFKVPAEADKGNEDRLLPIAPEFCETLSDRPESLRTAYVFDLPSRSLEVVSRTISGIGEAAGVVVDRKSGKFASAHDLRRSFGERWASRVMPTILMQLMRHESIETTMRFYVSRNSQAVAKACWEAIRQ